jgi:hypothetical protein
MTPAAEDGTGRSAYRDRTLRLILFGLLSVGVGLICCALALLQVAVVFLGALPRGAETLPGDLPSMLSGAALYLLLGAAFLGLGVGSVRRRRWVQPLMLTMAWTWLAGGLLMLLLAPRVMDALALGVANPEAAGLFEAAKLFVLLFTGGIGVLLPATFVWVYRDPDLLRTCEAHDPRPAWTERCPASVLGLSVGLAACAVLALPMLARPVVPFFDRLLTGWRAGLLLVAGAWICAWLARATFRLEPVGWWGTVVLLIVLGIGTGLAFAVVEPAELQRALGYPQQTFPDGGRPVLFGGTLAIGVTVVFTAAGLLYMARIRKHFARRAAR